MTADGSLSQFDDRVGYLDPAKGFAPRLSSITLPVRSGQSTDKSVVSQSGSSPAVLQTGSFLPAHKSPLSNEVKMITYSDAIPRPDLPMLPAPQLPNLSDSPLALLTAASGGELDLEWLGTFDNSTLESLVPRDPHTGRPLTVGSLDHGEGKCRPCIFFLRAKCFKGLRCSFCHFNHQTLRKPSEAANSASQFDLHSLLFPAEPSPSSIDVPHAPSVKSKRLRPSKRTREMIKQINEQMLFGDILEDPSGPPLSISQTVPSSA